MISFRSPTIRLLMVVALCAVSLVYYNLHARSVAVTSLEDHTLPIYCVEREEKMVALTFDAAWGADRTMELLQVLERYDAKATFFLVGFWVQHYPDMVTEIHGRGHVVGNHSENHPKMSPLNTEQMQKELSDCQDRLDELIGEPECKVFRPPFGDYNETVIKTCEDAGYYVIQWDVDSLDWKELSAQEIQARVLERVKPGSIVLMHNNGAHTAEALPGILAALSGDGYRFVTVPEIIYRDNYRIDHTGRQHPLTLPRQTPAQQLSPGVSTCPESTSFTGDEPAGKPGETPMPGSGASPAPVSDPASGSGRESPEPAAPAAFPDCILTPAEG